MKIAELVYSAAYEALTELVARLEEKGIEIDNSFDYIHNCAEYAQIIFRNIQIKEPEDVWEPEITLN